MVDPVDSRYDTITRSLAKARNESIFLNLVRASHDYPLTFTTIAGVSPTLSNQTGIALPTFASGGPFCFGGTCSIPTGVPAHDTVFGSTTFNNQTTVQTNFSVSTEEQGAFYSGILKPIDLITLDYFIRQDYPLELLYWLFADSFQLEIGSKALGYQYDPPSSYGCPRLDPLHRCFKDFVLIAVLSGLTVEEKTLKPGDKGETVVPRFCFSALAAKKAANEIGEGLAQQLKAQLMSGISPADLQPVCGGLSWNPQADAKKPQPDTFTVTVKGLKYRIIPRSAYGAFQFLGNLLKVDRDQLQPLPSAWYWNDVSKIQPPELYTTDDKRLITVVPGNAPDCFSHTWFYDGDYCVPESAINTKRIFSLLAQLIAIETTANDLSITPVVRTIQ
jgi:hypothetical protein